MSVLSVVIPALNEEGAIADIVERVLRQRARLQEPATGVTGLELIVVDDGSTDATAEIVRRFDGVRVVQHPHNRGYGAALKTGFAAATGEYLAFLDADGTYPPEALPELCEALTAERADMVVGTRLAGGGGKMPPVRRLGNVFYVHLVRWLTGARVSDAASGLRVFRAASYGALLPLPDGLDFTPAMTTRALHEDMRVREVPIDYEERVGNSKLSVVRDGWRFLKTILGVAHMYDPLRLYGLAAVVVFAAAVLLGIQPIWYYLTVRRVEDWEIYRLLTIVVLSVIAVNLATFGLFANSALGLIYDRDIRVRTFLLGARAQRWVTRHAAVVGALFMGGAVVLNHATVYQYVTSRTISAHWSYVLTGAFLFLVGAHLVMAAALLRTFQAAASHLVTQGRLSRAALPREDAPAAIALAGRGQPPPLVSTQANS